MPRGATKKINTNKKMRGSQHLPDRMPWGASEVVTLQHSAQGLHTVGAQPMLPALSPGPLQGPSSFRNLSTLPPKESEGCWEPCVTSREEGAGERGGARRSSRWEAHSRELLCWGACGRHPDVILILMRRLRGGGACPGSQSAGFPFRFQTVADCGWPQLFVLPSVVTIP